MEWAEVPHRADRRRNGRVHADRADVAQWEQGLDGGAGTGRRVEWRELGGNDGRGAAVIAMAPMTRALRYCGGSHTAADIEHAVEAGELQRWNGDRSTIITEIKQTPQQRILLYFLAEGDLTELRAMAVGINEWGQSIGCMKAQLIGRRGWERSSLRMDGWLPVSIVMEKALV